MGEALRKLIEKVRTGVGRVSMDDTDPVAAKLIEGCTLGQAGQFHEACSTPHLTAVEWLHSTILPGWRWGTSEDAEAEHSGVYVIWVQSPDKAHQASFYRPSGRSPDPARAWLLAILKAKLAEGADPERYCEHGYRSPESCPYCSEDASHE